MKTLIMRRLARLLVLAFVMGLFPPVVRAVQEIGSIRVLLLGDTGHHKPADFYKVVEPALRKKNIEIVYTEQLEDLNSAKLSGFDCLMIFANWTQISPSQEQALLNFVSAGGGFVPVHC